MSAISIITSLSLGALHALEPGHGKTFLASYTLSNKMNKKEVIKIISSLAISHALLLLILGLLVPILFPKLEETIHIYVQVSASILILFVGLKMLYKWKNTKEPVKTCSCKHHHSKQENNKAIPSDEQNIKGVNCSPETTEMNKQNEKSYKNSNPILVGFINGIMPCPSALAVVGIAFTYNSVWTISFVILAYVLGFIAAMFALLLAFVILKNKFFQSTTNNFKSQKKIQFISAVVIILSGIYYLFLAYNHSH